MMRTGYVAAILALASGLVKSSHEGVCLWIRAARRMSDLVQATTSSQPFCLAYLIHNPLLPSLVIPIPCHLLAFLCLEPKSKGSRMLGPDRDAKITGLGCNLIGLTKSPALRLKNKQYANIAILNLAISLSKNPIPKRHPLIY